jgi:hypothetical protein
MRIALFLVFTIVLWGCGTNKLQMDRSNKGNNIANYNNNAIGIWQVPEKERTVFGETNGSHWVMAPSPDRFVYDGKYVTLMLFTEKAWMWRSPDDLYKLKSKWSNDTLFYLPPFGTWEPLCIFKNDAFHYNYEQNDTVYSWTYKKITEAEIDSGHTDLVKKRKSHNYSIKPGDTYKE